MFTQSRASKKPHNEPKELENKSGSTPGKAKRPSYSDKLKAILANPLTLVINQVTKDKNGATKHVAVNGDDWRTLVTRRGRARADPPAHPHTGLRRRNTTFR